MMDGSESGNTEPVPTPDPIELLYIESSAIGLVEFRRRLGSICASERLKGQIKEVKRCIKGMGAAAHLMDRAELQERLAELEALQTQLEGETMNG